MKTTIRIALRACTSVKVYGQENFMVHTKIAPHVQTLEGPSGSKWTFDLEQEITLSEHGICHTTSTSGYGCNLQFTITRGLTRADLEAADPALDKRNYADW